MPLFLWKPSYEVDVPEIDMQHRTLVGMINELFDAMKEGEGGTVLAHVLDGLMHYVQEHFTTEERLMSAHAYPGYDGHIEEHLNFTCRVLQLREEWREGKAVVMSELMKFMCDWLTSHITKSDKAFGNYLKENGIRI